MPRYYSLEEASHMAVGRDGQRLAPVSLRAAINRGYLRAHKQGRNWVVSEGDLRAYLRGRPRWWKPRPNRQD